MKYPSRQYSGINSIRLSFPAKYYSIVEHIRTEIRTVYRIYDSMGTLVHEATVIHQLPKQ